MRVACSFLIVCLQPELLHIKFFTEFIIEWQLLPSALPPHLVGTGPLLSLDWHWKENCFVCLPVAVWLCVSVCVCYSAAVAAAAHEWPQTPESGNGNPHLVWTLVSMVPLPDQPCPFSHLTYDVIMISGRDFFSALFFVCQRCQPDWRLMPELM